MRIKQFIATAVLAVAATGVATATAHGEAGVATPIAMSGNASGIEYQSTLSNDHRSVVTHLTGGTFGLSEDGSTVTIKGADGNTVEEMPTGFDVGGQHLQMVPRVNANGSTLTLRPAGVSGVQDVADFNSTVQDEAVPALQAQPIGVVTAAGGLIVGAVIGAVIGTLIGAIFLLVGAIPGFFIGAIIGAIIGVAVGGVGGFFIIP